MSDEVERGIPGLLCPKCGDEDSLSVRVHDGVICCSGDNECEITTEELTTQINGLTALLEFSCKLPTKE